MPPPPASEPVSVPPALAAPLLRVLVRALVREVREDGGIIPAGIRPFLDALAAQVDQPAAGSAMGTTRVNADTVEVSVGDAARVMGASREYVRRLCRAGVLPARRVGRPWLITIPRERLTDEQDH